MSNRREKRSKDWGKAKGKGSGGIGVRFSKISEKLSEDSGDKVSVDQRKFESSIASTRGDRTPEKQVKDPVRSEDSGDKMTVDQDEIESFSMMYSSSTIESTRGDRTAEKQVKDPVRSEDSGDKMTVDQNEIESSSMLYTSSTIASTRGDRTAVKVSGLGKSKVTTTIGYIHDLSDVIRNKANTHDYCTLKIQTSQEKLEDALLYSPTKRKILASSEKSRTPVKLQKLTYTKNGEKIIINDITRISSPDSTEYNFQYKDFQVKDDDFASIKCIAENAEEYDKVHVKGKLFEVKQKHLEGKQYELASGFLSDGNDCIPIDIWQPHCSSVKNECAYEFTDLIVRVWQGRKKLSVSRMSKMELINDSELMDVTEDEVVKSLVDDQVTITDIDNVSSLRKVDILFTCVNCKKKLDQVAASLIVHCDKCGHTMKTEKCTKSVIVSFVVDKSITLTAFKESLENVLSPETMEDKDQLEYGFLMLSGINIHYNKRSHVVTKFVAQ